MQRRLENHERFKTRTLSESSLSPEVSSASPPLTNGNDLQYLVQKEANRVLKKLRETNLHTDDLLECETLSLVSNEDDSEHNSGSSMNYRTYTKSCSVKNSHLPSLTNKSLIAKKVICASPSGDVEENQSNSDDDENLGGGKPKIVKPEEKLEQNEDDVNEERAQVKAVRGRRKPLYSKTTVTNTRAPVRNNIKPIRSITSNLVKNVTSAIKSGTNLKNVGIKQNKIPAPKAPAAAKPQPKALKPPSGYKVNNTKSIQAVNANLPKVNHSSSNSGNLRQKVRHLVLIIRFSYKLIF